MEKNISRPASVWIIQIILVISGIPWTLMSLMNLVLAFTLSANVFFVVGNTLLALVLLAISGVIFAGVWGMAYRKNYGRIIGIVFLSLILFFGIVGFFARPQGSIEYAEYKNSVEWISGMITTFVIIGLLAWLDYCLIFGKKVNAFFGNEKAEYPDPPPPDYQGEISE